MLQCGLLGEKLSHSYSPILHNMLGAYAYRLYEKQPQELETFLRSGSWDGLNVTIPYKKAVLPYLDAISDTVKRSGSVNTIVRRPGGELFGDNTDVYGFTALVRRSNICVKNKKVLVLGSGGASASVVAALEMMAAKPLVISRTGQNNYATIGTHKDAQIIVNTTPLGMYPNTGKAAVDLRCFPDCCGVFDIVYNPGRTALLLQAEELAIPHHNGLYMLVAQAKRSAELFTGCSISDSETERVFQCIQSKMQNIVLIGMPGSGKTTVAEEIGRLTGRKVLDSDAEITRRTGKTPAQIILQQSEEEFRDIEQQVLADFGKCSGAVIATGGGAVVREENYTSLHQNGTLVWIRRELSDLCAQDRPLSQQLGVEILYAQRKPLYQRFADISVDITSRADSSASMILTALYGGENEENNENISD